MDINTNEQQTRINTDNSITFPQGIPGFENLTQFKLFAAENDNRLFWLRSEDEPEIEFAVSTPENLGVNYEITLSDEETALIQLDEGHDLVVLVTLIEEGAGIPGVHGNFLGPIIINTHSRTGFQKLLKNPEGLITIRA